VFIYRSLTSVLGSTGIDRRRLESTYRFFGPGGYFVDHNGPQRSAIRLLFQI
jgi:hypothetical protein